MRFLLLSQTSSSQLTESVLSVPFLILPFNHISISIPDIYFPYSPRQQSIPYSFLLLPPSIFGSVFLPQATNWIQEHKSLSFSLFSPTPRSLSFLIDSLTSITIRRCCLFPFSFSCSRDPKDILDHISSGFTWLRKRAERIGGGGRTKKMTSSNSKSPEFVLWSFSVSQGKGRKKDAIRSWKSRKE